MNNFSPLLTKQCDIDRFINRISISQQQERLLLKARRKIRNAIRRAFKNARDYLKGNSDIREGDLEWITRLVPKFMTQGSFAYKTLNSPCYKTQEMDLDDGVYLPMSILKSEPEANKDWFFAIVDGALRKLASQEGWVFSSKKDTCSRIVIPQQQAHIDVPLYAVPDDRHAHMTEAVAKAALKLSDAMHFGEHRKIEMFMLDSDQVYLATRKDGWKKSDPLLIAHWFKRQVERKGRRLRRICRFLKAWRDFTWEAGGPSSITLMAVADEVYPLDDRDRDDYALLKVVESLPVRLRGIVKNPACRDETLYPRGDTNQEEFALKAEELLRNIQVAMSGANDAQSSVNMLISQFGIRMPNEPGWIESIAAAATAIREAPAQKVKPDPIPNLRSG